MINMLRLMSLDFKTELRLTYTSSKPTHLQEENTLTHKMQHKMI